FMLWNDIRHSFRAFAKSPMFVLFSVLTIALGVGVNTTVFQFVHSVLLQDLPVKHPEQLYGMARVAPRYYKTNFSYPLYRELAAKTDLFAGALGRVDTTLSMRTSTGAEVVRGELVTGNYHEVLGVGAELGRTLTEEDDVSPGAHPVAVLSYGFWERRF